jgi:hypothetical protein
MLKKKGGDTMTYLAFCREHGFYIHVHELVACLLREGGDAVILARANDHILAVEWSEATAGIDVSL